MNILGNILQLSTALAKCINLAYGLGPRSLTDVSTSNSKFTFLDTSFLSVGTTILSSTITCSPFVFSLVLLLNEQLTSSNIPPSPKATYFLTRSMNIYDVVSE